jgi:ATP-dependent protease ClpP protease subunit
MNQLRISGIIGSEWDGLSEPQIAQWLKDNDGDFEVVIHSPGGFAYEGVAIFNLLKERKPLVRVTGLAASAASVVAMAGREILMHTGSQLMIHDAWGMAAGGSAVMRDYADHLDKLSESVADIYASRGVPRESARSAMRAETWYTADEAVAFGLATHTEAKPAEEPDEAMSAVLAAMGCRCQAKPEAVAKADATLRALARRRVVLTRTRNR